MTDTRKKKLRRKLQESRYRLCVRYGDFAYVLKDMLFVAVDDVYRISTNGFCIYFDPDWLQKIENNALDFMLSHQLMHIDLEHIDREKYYRGDRFHLGCDVVANAQLYEMGFEYEKLPGVGNIFTETFYPCYSGKVIDAYEAFEGIPFDPATMTKGQRRTYMIDTDLMWDKKEDRGEGGVIVLSPEDETPEDLYYEYPEAINKLSISHGRKPRKQVEIIKGNYSTDKTEVGEGWDKTVEHELKQLKCMKESDTAGDEERFDARLWMKTGKSKLDWKSLLHCFVQPELCDYSFMPPDRRFYNSDFFLPDFNVTEMKSREVLFMIDTSGSIDNDMLSMVYTELYEALLKFDGSLIGRAVFFDTVIHNAKKFGSVGELSRIIPAGGGGTDFKCIFKYVRENYKYETPASIVIFTDGDAPFPDASEGGNIPVLWLFTKKGKNAPWGQSVWIK